MSSGVPSANTGLSLETQRAGVGGVRFALAPGEGPRLANCAPVTLNGRRSVSKAAGTLGALWVEGEASGTDLLINSVNWVDELGTSQPAGSIHLPTLTVQFEERAQVIEGSWRN